MSTLDGREGISIPLITCPTCGSRMRLAGAEPEVTDPKLRITFDCECGFEYRLSEKLADGLLQNF